ncbi:MAG: hypothetical protein CMP91_07845 [Gammaproteobacteria bacterium]|nr:hypothetical protein [Gammaproteobacteria bacterium]|tara:strand:- start:299294 stop:301483 length:2190 start_codon:yes stop_codon:yes gene_type:complete
MLFLCPRLLIATQCFNILLSSPAFAQNTQLQEIVVHAQNREQNLSEAPLSISVVGENEIDRWNFSSMEELQQLVPNLKIFSQFAYNNTLALRGVGTYSRNIGFDERVGIYIDGIYLGPAYGLSQNLLDLAQVEVLRGPQATFFGRNNIAGAVQLISSDPDSEFGGKVLLRAGNLGTRILQGRLSIPLAPDLLSSISLGQQSRDGTTTNLFTGQQLDNRDRNSMRLKLAYTPGSNFSADLSIDRNEIDESMLIGDPLSDTFGVMADSAAPAPFQVAFNTTPTQRVTTQGAGIILQWELSDNSSFQSLTGLRETEAATHNDTDYSSADILHIIYNEDYRHLTQEFRFSATVSENISYLVGLNYLNQRGETNRHALAGSDAALLGLSAGGDIWNAGLVDTQTWGVYGNLDFRIMNSLSVSAGLRWSIEEKQADWIIDSTAAPLFGLATGAFRDSRRDSDVSPTISISHDILNNAMLFVRYAEGFKSGGYNLDYVSSAIFPGNLEFDKESAQSIEAGIKGSMLNDRAWVSLTGYHVEYRDFQVNQFRDQGDGTTVILISNAAEVETRGLELSMDLNLTDNLVVSGNMAYLDARYSRFMEGGVGGTDVSGNRLDAPKIQANFSFDYEKSLSNSLLGFLQANFSYSEGYYVTPDNINTQPLLGGGSVPYGYIASSETASLKLGVQDRQESWRLALWVQNLFDESGVNSRIRDFFGTVLETRTAPRTYGIEATFQF